MKKILLPVCLLAATGMFTACGPKGNEPNIELIQDMMVQPAVKAQRYDDYFPNGISQRVPPEHTVPVGFIPYRWGFNADLAEKELKNPIAGQMTAEVLNVGQKYFETNCMVCHGQMGLGNGPVAAKFPVKIPSLMTDKIRGWTDTRIFHTITMGQGIMGPYASHIPQQYRWQVVNYIRSLQKTQTVTKADASGGY
jgi:mono/diheme cytochrome c family protein